MSDISKVVPNQNRTDELKYINLIDYLPNHLKDTESEIFLSFFQDYLNEMYEGTYRYVAPETLSEIVYEYPLVWLNGGQRVTSPNGKLSQYFVAGDYIKRSNDTKYYKIKNVIDDTTLDITEAYSNGGVVTYPKYYYDNFSTGEFSDFWKAGTIASSLGCDGLVPICYQVDVNNDRMTCVSGDALETVISNAVYGNFELSFGFHLNEFSSRKNKEYGFILDSGATKYSVIYANGSLTLYSGTTNIASIVLDSSVYDFSVTVMRDTNEHIWDFTIEGIKSDSSTWSDSISGIPVIGYHSKWNKRINGTDTSETFSLKIKNGLGQSFNYVEFRADQGFVSEIDPSEEYGFSDEDKVRHGFYGRNYFVTPEGTFVAYIDPETNTLKVKNVSLFESVSDRDARKGYTHISILEKIKRLGDLHDPDLIDAEYINYFASYLGFSLDFTSDTLVGILNADPNYASLTEEGKESARQDYLRFILNNIPAWYRIKSTDNALNILMYSFGIAAQVKQYYTSNYKDFTDFRYQSTGVVVPSNYYETPHFTVLTNLDENTENITVDITKLDAIVNAVNSMKPINTVFDGITGFVTRICQPYYISMKSTMTAHYLISGMLKADVL
jgi:hypothetical protein